MARENAEKPEVYSKSVHAACINGSVVLNQKTKAKVRKSFPKIEREKLQKVYTQCGAAYGPMRKVVRACISLDFEVS